jgi:hypothetical protein
MYVFGAENWKYLAVASPCKISWPMYWTLDTKAAMCWCFSSLRVIWFFILNHARAWHYCHLSRGVKWHVLAALMLFLYLLPSKHDRVLTVPCYRTVIQYINFLRQHVLAIIRPVQSQVGKSTIIQIYIHNIIVLLPTWLCTGLMMAETCCLKKLIYCMTVL